MKPTLTPCLAFAALWLAQVALALHLPLVADEAYYLAWSEDLALGYLDHPPGVAAWVALGFGHPRLPGLLLLPVAWLSLADAARRWGVERWRWVPALALGTPLGFASGLLATPDAPLVFCWCVALWAIAAERPVVLGLALGAALWAKSAAVVALPAVALALGARAGGPLLLALVVYAPHLAWSAQHDWLPWSFQLGRFGAGPRFGLPEALGGQLLVVTPGLFVLAVLAWRRPADALDRRLRALSLPILAAWLGMSLVTRVEANWPALAWSAALVLLLRQPARRLRPAAALAVAMTVVAAAALPVLHAVADPGAGPPRDGAALRACYAAASPLPPVAARYQEKALLDLAGPRVPYLRARDHRPSAYDGALAGRAPAPPQNAFLYLASPAALGDRCVGVIAPLRACGRTATTCRAAKDVGKTDIPQGQGYPPRDRQKTGSVR